MIKPSVRYSDFESPLLASFLWHPVAADYHPVRTQLSTRAVRETFQSH